MQRTFKVPLAAAIAAALAASTGTCVFNRLDEPAPAPAPAPLSLVEPALPSVEGLIFP